MLVHGAWNWADHWLGVAEHLAEAFTCSVLDRRGRRSSGDGTSYSFKREIEDIAAVLEAVGPGASLLGHSSGAIYSLEAARQVPVERLVLYEPPLIWAERGDPTGLVGRVRDLVDQGKPEDAASLFFAEEGRLDEEGLGLLRSQSAWEPMVDLAAICVREWEAILAAGLTVDRYRPVTVPTLLLAGSENLDHPSMATKQLGAALPDVRTVVLKGFRHDAHLLNPALVASEVRAFLASADT